MCRESSVKGSVVGVGVWLAASATLLAQPRAPVFRSGIESVYVTVTVQDRDGRFVGDLRPEEFEVLEDGRPQRLDLVAQAVEPGHDDALVLDLGLLLDTSESMMKELKLSQEAAVRFLDAVPRA